MDDREQRGVTQTDSHGTGAAGSQGFHHDFLSSSATGSWDGRTTNGVLSIRSSIIYFT